MRRKTTKELVIYIDIFEAIRFVHMATFDWFRKSKIPGFHFYGMIKLFTKVVLARFCECHKLSHDKLNEQRDCKTSP